MDAVYGWIRNLICCLCMLELLYHVVQNTKYQKYLRFFGGLIFMMLVLGPAFQMFDLQDAFEKALGDSLQKEAAWEVQEAAEALAGLSNEKIEEGCRSELERQIMAIVKEYGLEAEEAEVTLEEEDGVFRLTRVEIRLAKGQGMEEETAAALCAQISAVYGIAGADILVTGKG